MKRGEGEFVVLFCVLVFIGCGLYAEPPLGSSPSSSNQVVIGRAEPQTDGSYQGLECPVDRFRMMLDASPQQLIMMLSNTPTEARNRLLEKIREYRSMPAEERELKLRATELQWYFLQLVDLDQTNRARRLAMVPPELRKMLEDRLAMWDILPPPVKDDLSRDVRKMRVLFQFELMEQGTNRPATRNLAEAKEIEDRLAGFFTINRHERERLLRSLSESERILIQNALNDFWRLSPTDRARCLRAFSAFASMSPVERAEFLSNAWKWQTFSPELRETWRMIVRQVHSWPPLPGEDVSALGSNMNPDRLDLTNSVGVGRPLRK